MKLRFTALVTGLIAFAILWHLPSAQPGLSYVKEKLRSLSGGPAAPSGAAESSVDDVELSHHRILIAESPESSEAYEKYAEALAANGQLKEARRIGEAAVRLKRRPAKAKGEPSRPAEDPGTLLVRTPNLLPGAVEESSGETPSQEAEDRDWLEYHRDRVEKKPQSAEAHFEFAEYLMGQRQFGEAEKELELARRLKPDLKGAQRLQESLNRIVASEPDDRTFVAAKEILDSLGPAPRAEDLKVGYILAEGETQEQAETKASAANDEEKAQIRSRYGSLDRYKASAGESNRADLMHKYGKAGDWEKASRQYQRLEQDFPQSPLISAEYARLLIDSGKMAEAQSVVAMARSRFPTDARLVVLSDLLGARLPPDRLLSQLSWSMYALDR